MGQVWSKLDSWPVHNEVKFALVNHVSHIFSFWGPSLASMLIRRLNLFRRYKIQQDDPDPALVTEALRHVVQNIYKIPLLSVAFYRLLISGRRANGGEQSQQAGSGSEEEVGDMERGWAALRFGGKLPSAWTTFWQVAVAYLGYDLMFYWSHRWLHRKQNLVGGYSAVHKLHHRFYAAVGFASNYEHTIEGLMQLLNWYLPLGFAGWCNRGRGGMHISTVFWYSCFRWLETVDAHCGYDLPFSPFSFIPLFGGALAHDFHHSAVFGNYGATVIWDRLMGTEVPAFRKLRLARTG